MLTKLLKHEFKATGRFMWVIYAAMVLLSVAANISLRFMQNSPSHVLRSIAVILVVAWVLALVIGSIMTFVLLIKRFHQNLLTDEGYLMFTLPGNVHQLVLSKLIAASVWFMASVLVVILCVMIAMVDNELMTDVLSFIRLAWRNTTVKLALNSTTVILETLVLLFVSCAGSCLMFYSAMSIGYGCVNHKALKSVLAYFVMWLALETLGVFGISVFGDTVFDSGFWVSMTAMQTVHISMIISILVSLAVAAAFYGITVWNLKKRLNLA